MKKILTVGAFLILLGTPLATAQGTPDGETPANEGLCDPLRGGTPGLYGLCVAYCEALDCEGQVEAGGAQSIQCATPANRRILENYRRKMMPGDPDMPCVMDPCPCWTLSELSEAVLMPAEYFGPEAPWVPEDQCANPLDGFSCAAINSPSVAMLEWLEESDPDPCDYLWQQAVTVRVYDFPWGSSCFYSDGASPPLIRWQSLTPEERGICVDQLVSHAQLGGWSCFGGQ